MSPARLLEIHWKVAINNITSAASGYPQRQGAVVRSVAFTQEHRVHYGVQSATFVRTVFPGQAAGTYRLNGPITWQGAQMTAKPGTVNSSRTSDPAMTPYPPRNASAYYSNAHTRIVPVR